MFAEDELLPLSALQHLLFCERQCALIHIEGLWEENRLTVEGKHLHQRVDDGRVETRGDVRIAHSLPVRSLRLGLSGQADIVEFHSERDAAGRRYWRPQPVEYKRGRPKKDDSDNVQLCAQALCLEEMLDIDVPEGVLFYGSTRRRTDVRFDSRLRTLTEDTAARLHHLIRSGKTPTASYEKKCDRCSLYSMCLPKTTGQSKVVWDYLWRQIRERA